MEGEQQQHADLAHHNQEGAEGHNTDLSVSHDHDVVRERKDPDAKIPDARSSEDVGVQGDDATRVDEHDDEVGRLSPSISDG